MQELKDTVEGMLSKDYKERFKAEYHQVRIRAEALEVIIDKYYKHVLTFTLSCPIDTLERQLVTMYEYIDVLENRAGYEGIDLR